MKINDLIKKEIELNITKWNEPEDSAVYFICNKNGEIVYIGSTTNLSTRLGVHRKSVKFHDKIFFYLTDSKKKCQILEQKLIHKTNPRYNYQNTPGATTNMLFLRQQRRNKNWFDAQSHKKIQSKQIRQKIKSVMIEKEINQSDMAKIVGISRQRMHQIINNDCNLNEKTIAKIMEAIEKIETWSKN